MGVLPREDLGRVVRVAGEGVIDCQHAVATVDLCVESAPAERSGDGFAGADRRWAAGAIERCRDTFQDVGEFVCRQQRLPRPGRRVSLRSGPGREAVDAQQVIPPLVSRKVTVGLDQPDAVPLCRSSPQQAPVVAALHPRSEGSAESRHALDGLRFVPGGPRRNAVDLCHCRVFLLSCQTAPPGRQFRAGHKETSSVNTRESSVAA